MASGSGFEQSQQRSVDVHKERKGDAGSNGAASIAGIGRVTEKKKRPARRDAKKIRFISSYPVKRYKCGLRAGERIRIKQAVAVRNHRGKPTGKIYPVGEIWTVLSGAREKPVVVWLLQADGGCCTWDDSLEIFDTFEIVRNE